MMKSSLIPLVWILTACEPVPQPETGRTPNPAFETQIQAMEKAHAVEAQMEQASEAQRQRIENATKP